MTKNKKITLIVLTLAIFLGAFFFNSHAVLKSTPELHYENTIPGQTTVYDFMNALEKEGKITFTEKNYLGMGKFILSINGVKNEDKSWIYYVNGKKADIGVSNYKINKGDIVSWKYEKDY